MYGWCNWEFTNELKNVRISEKLINSRFCENFMSNEFILGTISQNLMNLFRGFTWKKSKLPRSRPWHSRSHHQCRSSAQHASYVLFTPFCISSLIMTLLSTKVRRSGLIIFSGGAFLKIYLITQTARLFSLTCIL